MYDLNFIKSKIVSAIELKQLVLQDEALLDTLTKVTEEMVNCIKSGGKVLFCGNGGSAADAQHISAELSGRFYTDRDPLYSEALHTNSSYLTAVANDYSYDVVYARLVKAQGRKGDILVGISTSGNSKNIMLALEEANRLGMITIGMTGASGGKMKDCCKYLLNVPSMDTPRIQEVHILLGHIFCEMIELNMFKD